MSDLSVDGTKQLEVNILIYGQLFSRERKTRVERQSFSKWRWISTGTGMDLTFKNGSMTL